MRGVTEWIKPLEPEEPEFDPRWLGACIPEHNWHFHRRLLSRYGVVLGPGQFSQIVAAIRHGRARLVKVRDKWGAIYAVRIKGAGGRVYIHAIGGVPVTAWPPRAARRLAKKAVLSRDDGQQEPS